MAERDSPAQDANLSEGYMNNIFYIIGVIVVIVVVLKVLNVF